MGEECDSEVSMDERGVWPVVGWGREGKTWGVSMPGGDGRGV